MIRFTKSETNENLELKLEGDLDIESTEVVELELIPIMEQFKAVSINFKEVPFIDSSGIGLLLNAVQSLDEKGIKVTITDVREEVMDVFDLLQIPEIVGDGVFV
ncbi:STAS domain-containing protein [Halalkalibacter alkaliphilus]|uniref:Anti-sigma factor antagonist n=1 Tax=Halalkalibacter alkaliphilus TaxID=2917993 RepID=A0A9X2CR34_9BACI|nr:STAS domain-containing protein [Halalkalibacter alkaliphilus]MCL7746711.1 STAS domain-containing protein [Halalkalibacter alkaliphilus]